MKEYVPVYQYSEQEAQKWNEQTQWRDSFKENCRCARFIEEQIRSGFDGRTLNSATARKAVDEFGFDRVFHVLANTMQEKSTDGRFSQSNRAWARKHCVPKEECNWAFTVDSHPAVVDGFINQSRKLWQEQGFFEERHCLPDRHPGYDYENRVVVISPTFFTQKYRKPEFQLMLAEHGFGCSPTASGRKVYGKILQDGEKIVLNRQDIIGVIREECMPDWAKQRLEELAAPKQEQESSQQTTAMDSQSM